jgi:hypothetical protein
MFEYSCCSQLSICMGALVASSGALVLALKHEIDLKKKKDI